MRPALVALLILATASVSDAGWEASLRKVAAGCDRIRVRSGGTCHRNEAKEKTLYESKDAGTIRRFLAAIDIDEEKSGVSCMCCGEPTFELYRGRELVAMIGFHHGRSLRWAGGDWKGDAALTRASAMAICRWLAEAKIPGPLRELEESIEREKVRQERWKRFARILPADAYRAFAASRTRDEARRALLAAAVEPADRAVLWLRMLGCHEGSWNCFTPEESLVADLLEALPPDAIGKALGELGADGWAIGGAARFVLEGRREEKVPALPLRAALAAMASHAFAHPRRDCRRMALAGVARVGGPEAVAALRLVLDGKVKLREMPETDRVDPGGMVAFRSTPAEVREPEDDRVVAAWLLHGLGAPGVREAATALLAKAEGKDAEVLKKILADDE